MIITHDILPAYVYRLHFPSPIFPHSQQMEAFFMGIAQDPELPGYEDFEKQAWGFKVSCAPQTADRGIGADG